MFKLTQTKATLYLANENASLSDPSEVYKLESGELLADGRLPASLESYDSDERQTLWTWVIEGQTEYAMDREDALDSIADWLTSHPVKATRLLAG